MRRLIPILGFIAAAVLGSAYSQAAEDASFSKDLTATIVLQGLPCDKVIDAKRNGDSDYTASCKDGNRYHVFVDSTGRVIVKKV
jgi:hypothetical protein